MSWIDELLRSIPGRAASKPKASDVIDEAIRKLEQLQADALRKLPRKGFAADFLREIEKLGREDK